MFGRCNCWQPQQQIYCLYSSVCCTLSRIFFRAYLLESRWLFRFHLKRPESISGLPKRWPQCGRPVAHNPPALTVQQSCLEISQNVPHPWWTLSTNWLMRKLWAGSYRLCSPSRRHRAIHCAEKSQLLFWWISWLSAPSLTYNCTFSN